MLASTSLLMDLSAFRSILDLHLGAFQDSNASEAITSWTHAPEEVPNGWLICRGPNSVGIAYSLSNSWNDTPWCVIEDVDGEDPDPVMFAETLEECVQEILYAGAIPDPPDPTARQELVTRSAELRAATRPAGSLPVQGDAFAIPHENGLYSVCRVILDAESEAYPDEPAILVFGSAWIGKEVPASNDPQIRAVLKLTHNKWRGKPHRSWISGPVPHDFIPIGTITPTPEELATKDRSMADWDYIRIHPVMQWEWDRTHAG